MKVDVERLEAAVVVGKKEKRGGWMVSEEGARQSGAVIQYFAS